MDVIITHADGTTDTVEGQRAEVEEYIAEMSRATVDVFKEDLAGVTLDENIDEVDIQVSGQTEFAGVLKDVVRDGAVTTLTVASYEIYAVNAEPTSLSKSYTTTEDSTVINNAIDSVPQLTKGSITNFVGGLSFTFSANSQAYVMRSVAETTGRELAFNFDKSVDYVDRVGADNSHITISPANQNVEEFMQPKKLGGKDNITHLIPLGGGEGPTQVRGTTQVASSWSTGDPKVYDTVVFKDILDETTIEERANTYLSELRDNDVEVEVVVTGEVVNLGDTFTVENTNQDLSATELRAVEVTTIFDSYERRHRVRFSSRIYSGKTEPDKKQADVDKYNQGFEGAVVPLNAGGGARQPVGPDHPATIDFYYPGDIHEELRVELHINGTNYRARSKGAVSGASDISYTEPLQFAGGSTVVGPNERESLTKQVPSVSGEVNWIVPYAVVSIVPSSNTPDQIHTYDFKIRNSTKGVDIYNTATAGGTDNLERGESTNYQFGTVSVDEGDTITWEVQNENTSGDFELRMTAAMLVTNKHSHPPEPGLIDFDGVEESPPLYPDSADVLINGTSQNLSLGDGNSEFTETIDLIGKLDGGKVNTISVTSSELGEVKLHVEGDVYRQPLGSG